MWPPSPDGRTTWCCCTVLFQERVDHNRGRHGTLQRFREAYGAYGLHDLLFMFKYPERTWLALRDLDGPEMNTLNELSRGIAGWLDDYRDLGHDSEVMLRVDRIGGG